MLLILACIFAIEGQAYGVCKQITISLPSTYSYTYNCPCAGDGPNNLIGKLSSTNKAYSKFTAAYSNNTIYSYVEEENSSGLIKSASHSAYGNETSCTIDPAFFTPVRVFHRGIGYISGLCEGIHKISAN